MKKLPFRVIVPAALFAGVFACLSAQTKPDAAEVGRIISKMTEALALREKAAAAVAEGREKPAAVIARLNASATSSGLDLSTNGNLAFAAIDVGNRLIALHKPAEAEEFFKAAESALVAAAKLPNASAQEKAQYLRRLSSIRANYLNAPAQAKADIEAAIALQPDDEGLKTTRRLIAGGNREIFTSPASR